jgi:hypothetical protein
VILKTEVVGVGGGWTLDDSEGADVVKSDENMKSDL